MQVLVDAGVEWVAQPGSAGFVHLNCGYGGKPLRLATDQPVPISARVARDRLWQALEPGRGEPGCTHVDIGRARVVV